MILIKNGRVVDAKSNTDEVLDVVIDGGKIKTIGKVEDDGSYFSSENSFRHFCLMCEFFIYLAVGPFHYFLVGTISSQ